MTARLKTWLDGVDLREKRIAALPLFRRYGRLTRAPGNTPSTFSRGIR